MGVLTPLSRDLSVFLTSFAKTLMYFALNIGPSLRKDQKENIKGNLDYGFEVTRSGAKLRAQFVPIHSDPSLKCRDISLVLNDC